VFEENLRFQAFSKYDSKNSFDYTYVVARLGYCMTCLSSCRYYNINYVSLFLAYFVSK
jgi:hypothetical protein